ncbi:MAG TPA: hypothetical protein VD926_11505, partial [Acidimicrobiales bacterium]|nr:hypothetical protein [Acidimicrobiales bacterium]
LVGIDLQTGRRYLIDQVAVKSMKSWQMKETMLDWSNRYPIFEWRVESNGVQSQLVQYNRELVAELANRGIRVTPHFTFGNKWDPTFGVETMAPLFHADLVSIPWAGTQAHAAFQPFIEQLIQFPMGAVSDRVMSWWFAELGCRQYLERGHLPMFSDRRVPKRVAARRRIVDFNAREVRGVSLADQRVGAMTVGQQRYGRRVIGRAIPHHEAIELPPEERPRYVNREGYVDEAA